MVLIEGSFGDIPGTAAAAAPGAAPFANLQQPPGCSQAS
jgi:hypothetical protein